MIRILVFLALLAALAAGFAWVADQPGTVSITWGGYVYAMRPHIALALLIVLALVLSFLIWGISALARLPAGMAQRRIRRRERKGRAALARGMVAVGAGDARQARQDAEAAAKYLGEGPLTLLLQAQTAQLNGDRAGAERLFVRMSEREDTKLLGLRGLYLEARRRGDGLGAYRYAAAAKNTSPLAWAAQAVLQYHVENADWPGAIDIVEANRRQNLIDEATANRLRAVLKTAIALDKPASESDAALELAREALRLAPGLVPAAAFAGRELSRRGNLRQAAKLLEAAWQLSPHPDVARAYLELRPGDSAGDRLARAKVLARLAPQERESRLVLARAALEAREFALARDTLQPLLAEGVPTARLCLLMADLEEIEHGPSAAREWLARASRAPHDKAWVAEGMVSDTWAPASPSGKLDAYVWQVPAERLSAPQPEERPMIAPAEPAALPEEAENDAPGTAVAAAPAVPAVVELAAAPALAAANGPRAFSGVARAEAVPRRPALYRVPSSPDDPGPEKTEE